MFGEEEGLSRVVAFDNCVASLFSEYVPYETQKNNPWLLNSSYSTNKVLCIIQEDKMEPNDGGDAYMQIACDF